MIGSRDTLMMMMMMMMGTVIRREEDSSRGSLDGWGTLLLLLLDGEGFDTLGKRI